VVNSATGAPIAGARVKLAVSNSHSDPLYTKTDDQGHFSFAHLSRGDFQLSAGRPGFMLTGEAPGRTPSAAVMLRETTQKYSSHPDVDLEVTVADHDVENMKIEMNPLPEIAGIVTFGEGCTPGPVRIMTFASGPSMGQTINATSDSDGKFVLTGLWPGRFSVKVLFGWSSPSVLLDGRDINGRNAILGPLLLLVILVVLLRIRVTRAFWKARCGGLP
jgi:hypothetical protein